MSLLPAPRKPVNYLNNRDILKEIHTSKTSYCHFTEPEYHRYDFIVDMPQSSIQESLEYAFKPETIQLARETRATRLSLEAGVKESVSPESILVTDLVFRVKFHAKQLKRKQQKISLNLKKKLIQMRFLLIWKMPQPKQK
jgi:hypothetical protein